jgi:hypothetical protein
VCLHIKYLAKKKKKEHEFQGEDASNAPYLYNLDQDPQMQGKLPLLLPSRDVRIGRSDSELTQDLQVGWLVRIVVVVVIAWSVSILNVNINMVSQSLSLFLSFLHLVEWFGYCPRSLHHQVRESDQ